MADLKTELDRNARRFRPAEMGFERMLERAERRHRGRRITAVTVALAVAVAGTVSAFGLIAREPVQTLAGEWRGIWPQSTERDARVAQTRANAGDDEVTWQLDAREVLFRFAIDGLNWVNVRGEVTPADAAGSGPITATISGCHEDAVDDSSDVLVCSEDAMETAAVTVERLLQKDPKGIWSVTEALVDGTRPSIRPADSPPSGDAPVPEGDPGLEVADFVFEFMQARARDDDGRSDTTRPFLSTGAREAYESHEGGLDLAAYGGTDEDWVVVDTWAPEADRQRVVIRIEGAEGTIRETLTVGPGTNSLGEEGDLVILDVTRSD
jgi:hypothetical protein